MKLLLGAVLVSLTVVSDGLGGRHLHMAHHGPMRMLDECARTAGLSNETMTKIRDSLRAAMKDMDPKKLREKLDPTKQAEDLKAVVKEAEPDKSDAFDSCLLAVEERMINRSPLIACANTTGVNPETVTKIRHVLHNSKAEKDMRKRHKQTVDDAKKAVEETDKDKAEAYEKCLTDLFKHHQMKIRQHHKGHGGAKGEEKAEAKGEEKPDEEAKPSEE